MTTMLRRKLGASGVETSAIGLGTWAIGGENWGGTDPGKAIEAIQTSIDEGIDLIDTAPIYGFGCSEELVGQAIKGRRDQVTLATKCGLVWGGQKGDFFFESNRGTVHKYLGADSIRTEVEASLRRLGTDRIDLYQTHWQDITTPIAETMSALVDLKKEGKIRAIGVSNVTPVQLSEYLRHGPIASAQEIYSMVDRELEADLFPLCARNDVGVLAYSPLAMGLLTGKTMPNREFKDGDVRKGNRRFSGESVTKVNAFLAQIEPIARAHQISIVQLVIAWTLHQPAITHVLCGARDAAQARENAAAARVALTPAEIAGITAKLEAAHLAVPKVYG